MSILSRLKKRTSEFFSFSSQKGEVLRPTDIVKLEEDLESLIFNERVYIGTNIHELLTSLAQKDQILLAKSSRVSSEDFLFAKLGIEKVIEEVALQLKIIDLEEAKNRDMVKVSFDLIQETATERSSEKVDPKLLNQLLQMHISPNEYIMLLTDKSLSFKERFPCFEMKDSQELPLFSGTNTNPEFNLNFYTQEREVHLFGYGEFPTSILSCHDFNLIDKQVHRMAIFSILSAHEFCHNLGLGHFNAHSDDYCLMSGMDDPNREQHVITRCLNIFEKENWLCENCLDIVERVKEKIADLKLQAG